MCKNSNGIFKISDIVHYAKSVPHSDINVDEKRSIIINNNDAILLLGCSYTYGTGLQENETFSFYLSKYLNKNVYNLGIPGGGATQAYLLTNDKNFYKNYPKVNLVIYTYIGDHINRLNEFLKCEVFQPYCNVRVIKKGDKYIKQSEWYTSPSKFYIFRFILKKITNFKNSNIFYKKNTYKFVDLINKTNDNIKKNYPNAKFVFLIYNEERKNWMDNLDDDIYILTTNELTDKNLNNPFYQHNQDPHPSKYAWEEIVPKLVAKLKEKKLI